MAHAPASDYELFFSPSKKFFDVRMTLGFTRAGRPGGGLQFDLHVHAMSNCVHVGQQASGLVEVELHALPNRADQQGELEVSAVQAGERRGGGRGGGGGGVVVAAPPARGRRSGNKPPPHARPRRTHNPSPLFGLLAFWPLAFWPFCLLASNLESGIRAESTRPEQHRDREHELL